MGACQTTPTTTHDQGNQPSDLRTTQRNRKGPFPAPGHQPSQRHTGSNKERHTDSPTPTRPPGDQVTGSVKHCLLTTKAPMSAETSPIPGDAGLCRVSPVSPLSLTLSLSPLRSASRSFPGRAAVTLGGAET
jgi:hypothetical protein